MLSGSVPRMCSAVSAAVRVDVAAVFGVEVPFPVHAFAQGGEAVPALDPHYRFDPAAVRVLLAGFACNRRVLLHGLHGTGKSTHIEQVAARLNHPCLRLNFDGHIGRSDLLGRDTLSVRDGQHEITFKEAALPYALQQGYALILDEYDAAPADTAFVLQRMLENDGALMLPEENRIIHPHPQFRLFATANTAGTGDTAGLYHGTSPVNAAQMDRWNFVVRLDYLPFEAECAVLHAKTGLDPATIGSMVRLAALTREAFAAGDLSLMLSPRTVLSWAQNAALFANEVRFAFEVTFAERIEPDERLRLDEMYQRCFG